MTDTPITPETVRKAMASASVLPYAHICAMAPDLARAYLAAMEENARLRDALEQLDASCTCREAWFSRRLQDPGCPAGKYGDIARAALGLPPRCQYNLMNAHLDMILEVDRLTHETALRDLKGGE